MLIARPRMAVSLSVNTGTLQHIAAPMTVLRRSSTKVLAPKGGHSTERLVHSVRGAAPGLSSPSFVVARQTPLFVRAATDSAATRSTAPAVSRTLTEVVRQWRERPARATRAAELPGAVRSRAVRSEPIVSEPPRVLVSRPAANAGGGAGDSSLKFGRAADEATPAKFAQAAQPLNVDALTSHVIQQIDRRLVAYRERMGRT
ncbi:MAG: hypothetical protein R2762_02830 [Bryobacteraceae bacterium]